MPKMNWSPIDFRGNPHSSIVDSGYTRVVGANCVKVLAWYDNEWGYSSRCRDLIKFLPQNCPELILCVCKSRARV